MKIDIGCGHKCKAGFVGVDFKAQPGVAHVVNLDKERLPFEDDSVEAVFSSHSLEHLRFPMHVLSEVVRVAKHGTGVEIWTPYSKSNLAFLASHVSFFNETVWEHWCLTHADWWWRDKPGLLHIERFHYVISGRTQQSLKGMPLPFAIQHFHNVVLELGVFLTVKKGAEYRDLVQYQKNVELPDLTYGCNRSDVNALRADPQFWKLDG